jgi:hypothetical protein
MSQQQHAAALRSPYRSAVLSFLREDMSQSLDLCVRRRTSAQIAGTHQLYRALERRACMHVCESALYRKHTAVLVALPCQVNLKNRWHWHELVHL